MEKISTILKEFWWIGIIGIVGVGIVGYGVWGVIKPGEVKVEILKSQIPNSQILNADDEEQAQIVVDVAGAVEKPGVYRLSSGSRIGDALVVAGGLGEKADREWVSKTLNLAEVVKDGGKVYIPEIKEADRETPSQLSKNEGVTLGSKVNINTASVGELDALAGIGEVRAKAIVDNRPYGSTQEIVSKAKVPPGVYEDIKDSISIY